MTCEMMDDLISCYVDGALDEESRLLVERHLQSCQECRETLGDIRSLTGVCALAETEPPAALREGILAAVASGAACQSVAGLLPLSADASLDAAESDMVAAHVRVCASCATDLRQYEMLLPVLPLAEAAAPEGMRERIAGRTYRRLSPWSRATGALGQVRWPARVVSVAAGACVIAALAWTGSQRFADHTSGPVAGTVATAPMDAAAPSDSLAREVSRPNAHALVPGMSEAGAALLPRLRSGSAGRWQPSPAGPKLAMSPAVQPGRLPLPASAQGQPETSGADSDLLPAIVERPEPAGPAAEPPPPSVKTEPLRLVLAEPGDVVKGQEVDVTQRIRDIASKRQAHAAPERYGEVAPGKHVTIKFWQARF